MKVCILGNGLTGLTLAKALVNQGIYVDILSDQKVKNQNKTRTLGISKKNIDYFNKNILNLEKLSWSINKIEIYSENLKNQKVLNFENNNQQLFAIVKSFQLHNLLLRKLNKDKLIKFKKITNYQNLIKKIIN